MMRFFIALFILLVTAGCGSSSSARPTSDCCLALHTMGLPECAPPTGNGPPTPSVTVLAANQTSHSPKETKSPGVTGDNALPLIFFGVATFYSGIKVLQIVPTFFKLLTALRTKAVKWLGPRIHDQTHDQEVLRERLGVGYQNLFSSFIFNTLGVAAAFGFSLSTFLASTPFMSDSIRIDWSCGFVIATLFVLLGGMISVRKVGRNIIQVNLLLSNLAKGGEPIEVDGESAEAKYAIEHPLIGQNLHSGTKRALDLFYESTKCQQDGNERRVLVLYQEAMRLDPSLHKNALQALSDRVPDSSSKDKGAIYYWMGIHSEYTMNWKRAANNYEKAIAAFEQIEYWKRASRAQCNLGNVKMQLRDPSAMEEFEGAIALHPGNGTAYINIGAIYYGISERGDPRFEQALDAFADAVVADPATYGPMVISKLRSIGYTWKEDWEDVLQRVATNWTWNNGQTPD